MGNIIGYHRMETIRKTSIETMRETCEGISVGNRGGKQYGKFCRETMRET